MPRSTNNPVDDPRMTLRLKCGIHTIFLFVMLDWTFAQVSQELLEILHDRYPNGLMFAVDSEPLPLPEGDVKVVYGIPRSSNDLNHGWKRLKVEDDDTVESSQLADVSAVAFALVDPEKAGGNVSFDVTIPQLEDYDEEY